MTVKEYLKENLLIFDGAMGTMLQNAGLPTGGLPEVYNIEQPDTVLNIHKAYVNAGADVITTNTFQANRLKLRYKDSDGKTQLAHTLNGSSLALPRVVAALLENNQKDGKIVIPEALRPYTGFDTID